MRLAIMQPYLLPYIGYWQLVACADRFVVYDDVNYINRGWINRNRVLIGGQPHYITIPLHQASQNKYICDIGIQPRELWLGKMLKTVVSAYRRAPYYDEVYPVLHEVLDNSEPNLARYLFSQIRSIARALKLDTEFVLSSEAHPKEEKSGQDRILEICRREKATEYINAIGGQALYDPDLFRSEGIDLRFVQPLTVTYAQRSPGFVPHLSILDTLMEIGFAGVRELLLRQSAA